MESQAPLWIRTAAAELISIHFTPCDAKIGVATYMSVGFSCRKFTWYLLLVWIRQEDIITLYSVVFRPVCSVRLTSCRASPVCMHVCVHESMCAFYLGDMTSNSSVCVRVCVCEGGDVHVCVLNVKPDKPYIYLLWQKCVCHIYQGLRQTDGEPRPRPCPACIIYGCRWCWCLGTAAKQWYSGLLTAAAISSQSSSNTLGWVWR